MIMPPPRPPRPPQQSTATPQKGYVMISGNSIGGSFAAAPQASQPKEPEVLKMTPEMLREMEASIGGMAIVSCALWIIFLSMMFFHVFWPLPIWSLALNGSVALSYNLYMLTYWVKLYTRFKSKVHLMS